MDIKTVEELRKEQNEKYLNEFKQALKLQENRTKFLRRVHDTRDFLMWLAILPVTPIIAIIQAIRGEL